MTPYLAARLANQLSIYPLVSPKYFNQPAFQE